MVIINNESGLITFNLTDVEKRKFLRRIQKEIERVETSQISSREKKSRLKYLNNIIEKHWLGNIVDK